MTGAALLPSFSAKFCRNSICSYRHDLLVVVLRCCTGPGCPAPPSRACRQELFHPHEILIYLLFFLYFGCPKIMPFKPQYIILHAVQIGLPNVGVYEDQASHILFTSRGSILDRSTHPFSSVSNWVISIMGLITTFPSTSLTSTSSPNLLFGLYF